MPMFSQLKSHLLYFLRSLRKVMPKMYFLGEFNISRNNLAHNAGRFKCYLMDVIDIWASGLITRLGDTYGNTT